MPKTSWIGIGTKAGTASLKNVLELACGTGAVTKQLLAHLPSAAQLIATDLQPDMISAAKISIAKRHPSASNLTWGYRRYDQYPLRGQPLRPDRLSIWIDAGSLKS
jgi:SAM-dependent methyltransferase